MRQSLTSLFFGAFLLALSYTPATADAIVPYDDLAETIWASAAPHDRTIVGIDGTITVSTGEQFYITFGDPISGVYTIKLHWWHADKGINVVEHAVLLPQGDNAFVYTEARHGTDSGFPGTQGGGVFEVTGEDSARFMQMGHLLDGSASAFQTSLRRVDAAPTAPGEQSYPPAK